MRVKPWGIGRKDYSVEVVRVTMPTIKREQSKHWASYYMTIGPWKRVGFIPVPPEWDGRVPKGYKFALKRAEVYLEKTSLAEVDLLKDDVPLAKKFGYEKIIFDSDYCHCWYEYEEPIIKLTNLSTESNTFYINVYGIIEKVTEKAKIIYGTREKEDIT